ncbi:MAG TPA: hypothetical protein VGB19_06270 [Actinomycetota bacterium]
MNDLRTLLDREADRATESADGLERTLRKASRRQRRRGFALGVVAMAATAAVVGALWAGFTSGRPDTVGSPGPSSGATHAPSPSPDQGLRNSAIVQMRLALRSELAARGRLRHASSVLIAREAGLTGRLARVERPRPGETRAHRQARLTAAARLTAQLAGLRAREAALTSRLRKLGGEIEHLRAGIAAALLGGPDGDGPLSATVIVDPGQDIRFDPPPPDAAPALTASDAVAHFQAVDPVFQVPDGTTATLGLYTAPVGDGSFRFRDRLAWGLLSPGCPMVHGGFNAHPSPGPCRGMWLFLDANTGEMLESLAQS